MYRKEFLIIFVLIQILVLPSCWGFYVQKYHKIDRYQTIYIEPLYKYNWFSASNECASINMSLMMIDSKEKSDALTRLIKRTFGKSLNFWIGANDLSDEGNFVWDVNGQPLDYTNWNRSPDNYRGNEDCVHIHANSNYKWNDGNCQQKMGFICEHVVQDEPSYDE